MQEEIATETETQTTETPEADDHPERRAQAPRRGSPTEEPVLEALKNVFDPELGINIVDLGLVYDVQGGCARRRRHPVLAHHDGVPDRSR